MPTRRSCLPFRSPFPHSALLLTLCFISGGAVIGSVEASQRSPIVAQASPSTTSADLERRQQEADAALRRATALFFILLATLVLLILIGIALLWFLRRSVVQEVATVVRAQLNQMTDLEHKIRTSTRELNNVLKDAEDLADDIESDAEGFKDELAEKRRVLSQAMAEISVFCSVVICVCQSLSVWSLESLISAIAWLRTR
ncbi:MAG: hypothetical protein AAFW75_32150, partial [Cyanobacteria bacterium J06636_16]